MNMTNQNPSNRPAAADPRNRVAGNNNVVTIDLAEVARVIWQNIVLIILAAAAGALALYFISANLIHPKYYSTTKIYVMANEEVAKGSIDTSSLQAGMLLTKDYEQIIKSRQVTESVIADLDLDLTSNELRDMMTVEIPDGTRVISISVTAGDPYMAADICDEIRNVSMKRIQQVMDMKAIEVVESANIPRFPSSPNSKRNAVLGGLVCALIAIIAVVVDTISNNTIKTSEDIERYLGLSILGTIPYDEMEDEELRKRKSKGLLGRLQNKRKKHGKSGKSSSARTHSSASNTTPGRRTGT